MGKKRYAVQGDLPLPKPEKKEKDGASAPGMPKNRLHYFVYSKLTGHCVGYVMTDRQRVINDCARLNGYDRLQRYDIGTIRLSVEEKNTSRKYWFDCSPIGAVKEPHFSMIDIKRRYYVWAPDKQIFVAVDFEAVAV